MRRPVVVIRGGWARAAAAFLALVTLGAAAPGKFTLGLRPRRGVTYSRLATFNQNIFLGGTGGKLLLSRSIALALSFRAVETSAAGDVTVEGEYLSLAFAQNDLTGSVSWDSSRPGEPVPSGIRHMAPLVGRKFRLVLSADGRLLAIEGADRGAVDAIMSFFPPGPVQPGDSWSSGIDLAEGGAVRLNGVLTLRERRAGKVVVDVAATIRQRPGTSAVDLGGFLMGTGVTGSLAGPLELEDGTGVPVRAGFSYTFSGQVEPAVASRLPFTLAAPFSGEGSFRIEPY